MAKLERVINEDMDHLLTRIEQGILDGSISASLEDSSDYTVGDARCCHRVFERYSMIGENRVSMSIMLFQSGDSPVYLSAITSGGSQAVLFKINTWGEEAFLEKLIDIL